MSKKKTKTKPALAPLDTFEGRDVVAVALIVTNTGDGLSESMEIDPTILHHGDGAYLVMKTEVVKIRHDPVKDANTLTRVQILKASTCLIADPELVGDLIAKQELRIEEAKGISRLPLVDGQAVPTEEEIAAQAAREADAAWENSVRNTLDGANGSPAKTTANQGVTP